MENSRQTLIDALLNDQSHHIEFNGHLTNHNKHAVIALNGLGAPLERIKSYYDAYALNTPYGYGLEPPKVSKYTITQDNWMRYLGKRTSYSSYCDFFDLKEKELGTDELLKQYLPTLLPGWVGSLTHATIHIGWALDANHRWMLIEGLAYLAFSYVSCHPERAIMHKEYSAEQSAMDSLLHIAGVLEQDGPGFQNWVESLIAETMPEGIHPELVRSGLQYRIARLLTEGHPLIYMMPSWMENLDAATIWHQLHYLVTILYMVKPGDFLMLHLITSLYAMEKIAEHLPPQHQKEVIRCFWVGTLCILFSRGEFPKKMILEALNFKYQNAVDDEKEPFIQKEWEQIIARALGEEEEHNPKMVYVLQRMWKTSGHRSIFRVAAAYFTTTPELPKSFEAAPIE